MLTEDEIRIRIKGAKNKNVFTKKEIEWLINIPKNKWISWDLANQVKYLIYPFTKLPKRKLKK